MSNKPHNKGEKEFDHLLAEDNNRDISSNNPSRISKASRAEFSSRLEPKDIPAYQRTNAKNVMGLLMRQQYPASVPLAEFHNRITGGAPAVNHLRPKGGGPLEEVPYCPCCGRRVVRGDLSICTSTTLPWSIQVGQQRFELSSGACLFFQTIKVLMAYLLLRLIIVDGYNIYSSYYGHYCKNNPYFCGDMVQSMLSGYNNHALQDRDYQTATQILHLLLTIISIPFFAYWRAYYYKVNQFLDHMDITDDDFSILVQKVPPIIRPTLPDEGRPHPNQKKPQLKRDQVFYEQDLNRKVADYLKGFFTEKLRQTMVKQGMADQIEDNPVVNVNLAYDVTEFTNIHDLTENVIDHLQSNPEPETQVSQNYIHRYSTDDPQFNHLNQKQQLNIGIEETKKVFKMNAVYRLLRKDPTPDEGYLAHYLRFLGRIDQLGEEATALYIASSPQVTNRNFRGTAFVTFRTQAMRNLMIMEAGRNPKAMTINGTRIKVDSPTEPEDILWHNLSFPDARRRRIFIMNIMVLAMCIGFSFAIDMMAEAVQMSGNDYEEMAMAKDGSEAGDGESGEVNFAESQFWDDVLNYGMIVVTYITNYWLGWVIEKITVLERHKTHSKLIVSLVIRGVIAKFINTGLTFLLLQLIFNKTVSPIGPNGLVAKIFQQIVLLGIIDAVINLIQPQRTLTYWLSLREHKGKNFVPLPQSELNEELAYPEFDIVDRYSSYIYSVYLGCFYAVFVPQITPILLITFFVQYWIDKYNYLRRNSFPSNLNSRLSKIAMRLSEFAMLAGAIGSTIFFYWINIPTQGLIEWIAQGISIVLVIGYIAVINLCPKVIWKCFGASPQKIEMTYTDFRNRFVNINTFWSQNPATKRIGKLSAKVIAENRNSIPFSELTSRKLRKFQQESDNCERALRDLFLPQDLNRLHNYEERYEPVVQTYSEQEVELFNRCFNKS